MRNSTWTVKSFENGETGRVETGVPHKEAVVAIDRAIHGLDPFAAERSALHVVDAESIEPQLAEPVAA